MASKLIGIVGATGTGKSTSIKHLNPKETYIINVAKKELPFKGSEKLFLLRDCHQGRGDLPLKGMKGYLFVWGGMGGSLLACFLYADYKILGDH